MRSLRLFVPFVVLLALSVLAQDQATQPHWIWSKKGAADGEFAYLRKTIDLKAKPKSAVIAGAADNNFTLWINGKQALRHEGWNAASKVDITNQLHEGKNAIAVRAQNEGGAAGFICELQIEHADGSKERLFTGVDWLASSDLDKEWQKPQFDDSQWKAAVSVGALGTAPWGKLSFTGAKTPGKGGVGGGNGTATAADTIKALPGFKVEMLYSVPRDEQGSWVNLTSDPKGRLIASDQYGALYRVVPGKDKESTKVEKIPVELGEAQGLLWAFDSLYVVVNRGQKYESGLYRVTDTDNDDQLDKVEMLKKFDGGGEHGPHAIRLGPDGKTLWVIAGNHTNVPKDLDPQSPLRNWDEDHLLPRNPDGNGHATGRMAPGGWILRTDKDGNEWDIFCGGFRNQFDIAFNQDGELFSYDADMEWDTGAPWYRPTRVNHAVSAAEFGWRYGTGKWPEYYADSLGAVVNIGLGSPTGIEFGTGAKFPERYQRALFLCEWTYGKLYAVHMTPSGSGYVASFETFVEGKPLPLTDVIVNPIDGAMYFTIGGRKTQSGLYRVTYTGEASVAPVGPDKDDASVKARALRHSLEAFHGKRDPKAIEAAWPHVNSGDRNLRYAARVAIEHQDPSLWAQKALAETRTTAAVHLMIALARANDKQYLQPVVEKLNSLPLEKLTEEQILATMRAYSLAFLHLGKPDAAMSAAVEKKLLTVFPSQNDLVNREVGTVLVYLRSKAAIEPLLKLLAQGYTQEDQMYFEFILRNVPDLMNDAQRRQFFSWCNLAEGTYRGGSSFKKFVQQIRRDAVAKLSEADRAALKDVIEDGVKVETVKLETTRQFLHNYQMEDLQPLLGQVEKGRNFEKGKAAYMAAQCYKCHRFAGEGGDTGPDITGVGNRFNAQYIAESIIVPSKAVSDQYASTAILTKDGEVIAGRVIDETGDVIKIRTDPFARQLTDVKKEDIDERRKTPISEMPQGLINVLSKDEILDLIAYLRSAGKADDAAFKP